MKILLLIIACLSLLSSSGCMCLVAGGAGAEAGYVAGKDDQTTGEVIDDQWITAKVKTQLLADTSLNALNINVDTDKGVVTLTGTVKSSKEKGNALAIANGTKGVKKVIDRLKIK